MAMLTTTSDQLRAAWSRGDATGIPMAVGAAIDQGAAGAEGNNIFVVPKGQVLLITKVAMQTDQAASGVVGAFNASPAGTATLVRLEDPANTDQGSIGFYAFRRQISAFDSSPVTNWRNAPPGNAVTWSPKYPVVVPSGWSVNTGPTASEFHNGKAVYGYLVDENSARSLGFQVSDSTTAANRRYGVASVSATTSGFVAARAGKHIRILEMTVRLQPPTAATNSLVVAQQDGRVLYACYNNNPSDFLDQRIAPSTWILGAGQELDVTFGVATSGSITVVYEYLDPDDVPGDAWWACVEPVPPTPALSLGSPVAAASSTQVTCYFPRRGTTDTAPGLGSQYVVQGFALSVQKSTTALPDQTLIAISAGTVAGDVALGGIGLTQSNFQVSPTYSAAGHDQCVFAAVDDIDVACGENNSLYIDTLGLDGGDGVINTITSTPDSGTADIANWRVCLWGRVAPKLYTNPSNRGV